MTSASYSEPQRHRSETARTWSQAGRLPLKDRALDVAAGVARAVVPRVGAERRTQHADRHDADEEEDRCHALRVPCRDYQRKS